jgi:Fur family ferric uptake transcriptional regulator
VLIDQPMGHDKHQHATTTGPERFKKLLSSAKLRVTPARTETLKCLGASAVALTASDIEDKLAGKGIDRVTVYRTLTTLVESGLAHRIDAGDRVYRYSLTDHSRCHEGHHEHDHPHLVCESCGSVQCLDDAQVVIQPRPGTKGKRGVWKVHQQSVTLRGVCESCQSKVA